MASKLYYIHDPMCSWCWGWRPTWDLIQQQLPSNIIVEYVVGGLAPDSDLPMPEPQQQMIKKHWRTIENKLGTQFNYDFWQVNTPRRSTYNACRAVIAAEKQSCQLEMINAIQQGYYLNALNPSDLETLIELARELNCDVAMDIQRFCKDITSSDTEEKLLRQVNLARRLTNQGFPSLVLECNGEYNQIPIDYQNADKTLGIIQALTI